MRRLVGSLMTVGMAAALGATAVAQTPPAAAQAPSTVAADSQAAPTVPNTLVIPAGTKVLLSIRSAINTKTAQAGDGVYLQSTFPVIANGRSVIPAGVYV